MNQELRADDFTEKPAQAVLQALKYSRELASRIEAASSGFDVKLDKLDEHIKSRVQAAFDEQIARLDSSHAPYGVMQKMASIANFAEKKLVESPAKATESIVKAIEHYLPAMVERSLSAKIDEMLNRHLEAKLGALLDREISARLDKLGG